MADSQTDPQVWSVEGFLEEFHRIHETMKDRSFMFLLGAGASISSGIPAGGTLAWRWIEELYRFRFGSNADTPIEDWATEANLQIRGFDIEQPATFYPDIYDKRFGDDPESGYAYLEDVMSRAEPNIGYSILAQVLERSRHKVVVSTNFDNLVADALSLYANTFPLVCGHESLTGFVRPKLRRPLVAKVHRDLLLAPKNDVEGTATLEAGWAGVLKKLLAEYTPLVIGYGGNDGSLMGFLDQLEPGNIRGGIFWFYRIADGRPAEHICRLVAKHRGKLVPIVGFDEFMLQLKEQLGYELLAKKLEEQSKRRLERYREQFKIFKKNLSKPVEKEQIEAVRAVREALDKTTQRETDWWGWELKAQAEEDLDKREQIYRQGLEEFPQSPELTGNFAVFMHTVSKDYIEAEQLYRRALKINPDDANHTGNFALFQYEVLGHPEEAEKLYRRSLELDPDDANHTGNFALFMQEVHADYEEAEKLYRRSLELDPDDANHTGNFALFMQDVRGDYDEAERLYRRSLELDPNDAIHLGNFAVFLKDIRKEYQEAEQFYRRALELDPEHALNAANYVEFLIEINQLEKAKIEFESAWELNVAKGATETVAVLLLLYSVLGALSGEGVLFGLGRLKDLLEKGFEKESWSFDSILESVKDQLSEQEWTFYKALAKAILDEQSRAALDEFEQWRQLEQIPFDDPWDLF